MPFNSEFPEEIVKNILDCKYDLEDYVWERVSPDAKDLIQRLLKREPTERISLRDALKHPWITVRRCY